MSKHHQPTPAVYDFKHLIYSVILAAYGFITVVTPNLQTLDSNGPKFLSLAILNFAVFLFLFTQKDAKPARWAFGSFFRIPIALAYSGLMMVSLISFTVALNISESILHFAKIFTTFSATLLVAIIIFMDKNAFRYLALAMSALLVFDSLSVFAEIAKYINGDLADIGLIKSVYSNKNILASSIFVKIPFVFWLIFYESKWGRIAGLFVLFVAILATLFLSTRAFYLATFFLTIAITLVLLIRYRQTRHKSYLKIAGQYFFVLGAAIVLFSLIQQFAYPETRGGLNLGLGARVASIQGSDGGSGRLTIWNRSINLIKENPLLGIGLGNWKIETLKEENLTSPAYIYAYKSHNDFLETTAETGIVGGILFLAIFALVFLSYLKALLKKEDDNQLKFLFIPALGLFCYAFDAFFNFPQDRPEIQALFALYAGAAIAFYYHHHHQKDNGHLGTHETRSPKRWVLNGLTLVFGAALLSSCYLLIWNFNSLKLQRLIKQEMNTGTLKLPASKFLSGFPAIPDINVVGEPIAAQKARYLINEKRYNEAIKMLKADHSSPYDTRPEFFIAMAYNNLEKYDSAMAYAQMVYKQKPRLFENITIMVSILEKQKNFEASGKLWDEFLTHTKGNARAWNYAAGAKERAGNIGEAFAIIDSALVHLPKDTLIQKNHSILFQKFKTEPYKEIYQKAVNTLNAKNYTEAASLFTAFIEKVPDHAVSLELRSFCWFYLKAYQKSIDDIDLLEKLGVPLKSNVLNLRGVNYQYLGKVPEACANFDKAAKMGDKDGISNYTKLCGNQVKAATRTEINPETKSANPLKIFSK